MGPRTITVRGPKNVADYVANGILDHDQGSRSKSGSWRAGLSE